MSLHFKCYAVNKAMQCYITLTREDGSLYQRDGYHSITHWAAVFMSEFWAEQWEANYSR